MHQPAMAKSKKSLASIHGGNYQVNDHILSESDAHAVYSQNVAQKFVPNTSNKIKLSKK